MLSGRRLDILDPSPLDIEIADIAHGLARVSRWNGQTAGAHGYSVAQHSVLVERIAAAADPALGSDGRLAALLHDAPEYVLGDVITPLKSALGDTFRAIETRLLAAIHLRFGLPAALPAALRRVVKDADRVAARQEASRLAGFSTAEARAVFGDPGPLPPGCEALFEPWPTDGAEAAFLARFAALTTGDAVPDGAGRS